MINWKRIFGEETRVEKLYVDVTLKNVRQAIIEREWTETLGDIFDSMLWRRESPREFAIRVDERQDVAARMHDHGYRALRTMAENGLIEPTWL